MKNQNLVKRLLADRILVLPDETESVTKGGIIIPDTAKEKPITGTVVQVGPGTIKEPMVLSVGQKVSFSKFVNNNGKAELPIDGKTYYLMCLTDVISVLH